MFGRSVPEEQPRYPFTGFKLAQALLSADGQRAGFAGLTIGMCRVYGVTAAASCVFNELDWPIWTCRAGHQRTSIIPGHEVSGAVAALGYGTAGIAVGDEVFGLTNQLRDGAAAEYVAVEAEVPSGRCGGPRKAPRCHPGPAHRPRQ